MAEAFEQEITTLYEVCEQEHEARPLESSLSPRRGPRVLHLSLERFRNSTKYQDRPAAADIAFCVAAFADGMTEDRIGCALEDNYLSRDPSSSRRAAYIQRTMEKARRWIVTFRIIWRNFSELFVVVLPLRSQELDKTLDQYPKHNQILTLRRACLISTEGRLDLPHCSSNP
jgi:hypothetical protein